MSDESDETIPEGLDEIGGSRTEKEFPGLPGPGIQWWEATGRTGHCGTNPEEQGKINLENEKKKMIPIKSYV